jgi:hypothetical protein
MGQLALVKRRLRVRASDLGIMVGYAGFLDTYIPLPSIFGNIIRLLEDFKDSMTCFLV